jgi:cytochrome c
MRIKSIVLASGLMAWHPLVHAQATDPCKTVADSEIKKVLLTSALSNPLEIAIAPDKRIFIVEKVSGKIRIFNPGTKQLSDAGSVEVFSSAPHTGLLGIALDPGFSTNHFVYVYYAHATEAKHELARFTESAGKLADASKVVLLSVPGVRWDNQHHSAGSLAFGPDGNLYLATGENVDPTVSQGYASANEAKRIEDTQATAANTNDLNGKILRIHPEAGGTYTIPAGNLFPASAKARGEIFAMGMRNPIRIAIDSKTGWVYWGEPGPDAGAESATRGPEGRDEINRAKTPGFFGWPPYFVGENLAYVVNGAKQNPERPVNRSPNNTGDSLLPPARPALLSYTDNGNAQYPAFEVNGARASIVGGLYRFEPSQASPNRLPPRFDGSLFIMDWSRDWINEVTLGADGEVSAVKPFLAGARPNGPIDMAFGPDGDMFLLEYDAKSLYQVQYTGTCKMDGNVALRDKAVHADARRTARKRASLPPEAYVGRRSGKAAWLQRVESP